MEISRRKALSGSRFLSFILNEDEYAVKIGFVKEIRGMTEITQVPQTPEFVRGVINLRGQIVPVVDLRLRFGMPFLAYHERTNIIIVEIDVSGEKELLGVIVDQIREVISLPEENIKHVPFLKAKVQSDYVSGMAELGERILIFLDIQKVVKEDEYVQYMRAQAVTA